MATSNLTRSERLRQHIWSSFLYPIWPGVERGFNFLHKKERTRYHIGWIAPGKTVHDLKERLASLHGFGNHFVAWTEPGQILSWRKLINFKSQYHIRVFNDGEIRGHLEVTPEAAPIKHFLENGEEDRTAEFLEFLGDVVTVNEHVSHVEHDKVYEQIGFSASSNALVRTYKVPGAVRSVLSLRLFPRK